MYQWSLVSWLVVSVGVFSTPASGQAQRAGRPNERPAVSTVPVRVFRVSDDDGGRPAQITDRELVDQLAFASAAFAPAGQRFAFDPAADVEPLRSTLLNNAMGVESADWPEVKASGNALAALHPGKLVIFVRHGPGMSPTGFSFSWFDYDFVACADSRGINGRYWILAHEIAHYFGLPHPHGGPREFPSRAEAEAYFLDKGKDPAVFDGDGLTDTPPIPAILDEYGRDGHDRIALAGVEFSLLRGNVPSYYHFTRPERDLEGPSFTPEQVERVRWMLNLRRKRRMAVPNHATLTGPIEAERLEILSHQGPRPAAQAMDVFFRASWSRDAQLFGEGGPGSKVVLALPPQRPGRYNVSLGFTLAPDYGIVRVSINGRPLGDVDGYGPLVVPAELTTFGPITLGPGRHTLTLEVVGKAEASRGARYGLDCLLLRPRAAAARRGRLP